MTYIEIRCIVCNKVFIKRRSGIRGRALRGGARKSYCITCGRACSKVYNKISQRIREIQRQKIKKQIRKKERSLMFSIK